jgi:hypothetical protein
MKHGQQKSDPLKSPRSQAIDLLSFLSTNLRHKSKTKKHPSLLSQILPDLSFVRKGAREESELARDAVNAYFDGIKCDDCVKFLPPPEMPFATKSMVPPAKVGNDVGYAQRFQTSTGINPTAHGRRVVNMSGAYNMCGFRAILSQCDPASAGSQLSPGSSAATSDETREKVTILRLAIACGRVNAKIKKLGEKIEKDLAKDFLLEEMEKLGCNGSGRNDESNHGMLEADDIKYISQALHTKIIVVPSISGQSNVIEVREYYADGDASIFMEGDTKAEGIGEYSRKDIQEILTEGLQDPKAIVLCNSNNLHFVSVQRVK